MTSHTPRERFLAALRGQQPDRAPVWDWVNNPADGTGIQRRLPIEKGVAG